ncbi:MAG: hypothetical protein PWP04_384 [Candidatus Atribacteria bacterium]|nr:hypothetical protein [Candidatus Atribacteria bacterium]
MAQKKAGQNPKKTKATKEKKNKKSSKEKIPRGRSNLMETMLPLVLFGITLVLFLNFAGFINLPYLDFINPTPGEKGEVVKKVEEIESNGMTPEVTYPGPTLDAAEPEELEEVEVPESEETPLPEGEAILAEETEEPEAEESETDEEGYWRLAKIYSAMKPQEAVQIMTNLPDQEVVKILSFMKEREVANILSLMEPERAADLLQQTIERR